MFRTLLTSLLLLTAALSGCLWWGDDDDDGDGPGPSPSPTPPPGGDDDFVLWVTIDNISDAVTQLTPINVSWSVQVRSDDFLLDNDTGPGPTPAVPPTFAPTERQNLSETGIVWGREPVNEPNVTQDYPNIEPAAEDAEAPGSWNASFMPGLGDGNNTTVYVRAYAIDEAGNIYWSDEATVRVLMEDPVVIQIGGDTIDGPFAGYDPANLTIRVGVTVAWFNNDTLGVGHTATSTSGPQQFDTGQIAAGTQSSAITFTTPGTYTYRCNVHPTTMETGTIVVVD